MFVSKFHLPQILPPECYFSEEHHQRELSSLFSPGWHFAGTTDNLQKEGQFATINLFDKPLLLWRTKDGIRAFANVCPHRFSTLTNEPCGHQARLTCQYHGWEFDENGDTRRIPDAESFRPLKKGEFGLRRFHSEVCGNLIFVNTSDNPMPLDDYLGPGFEVFIDRLSDDVVHNLALDTQVDANWKLVVENALETYHAPIVHAQTFAGMTKPEEVIHKFGDRWSLFDTVHETKESSDGVKAHHPLERLGYQLIGVKYTPHYKNYLFYPNIIVSVQRLYTIVFVVTPISPVQSRIQFHMFCQRAPNQGRLARLVFRIICHESAKVATKILNEDLGVLPAIQQGIQSPTRPSAGLISIREERLFHFQRYIEQATKIDSHLERRKIA